jgi:hypothetical protein
MTTFTEIVATVVVHSSAAALSHFGVTLEPAPAIQPAPVHAVERVIQRTPRAVPQSLASCPKPRIAAAGLRA